VLVLFLVTLQFHLWFGEGSVSEVVRLTRAVEQQTKINTRLKQRNATLEAHVTDLKSGLMAVEEIARMDLGMIKPGEVFIQVIE
jgi:cell division protein FtsB